MSINARGIHHIVDYKWEENDGIPNEYFHYKVFFEIEKIINKTSLKIVHKNLCMLPLKGDTSEIGGTLFYQLDSSHFSLHSYYDTKILAIDFFSCGDSDTVLAMKEIDDLLKSIIPSMKIIFRHTLPRFHYQ
jgi:S-adenosylmethionine/arginine decarboxylase-like enzyme